MVQDVSSCSIPAKSVFSLNDVNNSCFLCGYDKAIWTLNSRPNQDNEPFFPFLKNEKSVKPFKLDVSGKCRSCNICYIFLIQQWNSYEINKTPHTKRLYWLKNPQNTFFNQEEDPSEEQKFTDNSFLNKKIDSNFVKIASEDEETRINNSKCATCSAKIHVVLLKYIYTSQQNNSNIPFFADILCKEEKNDSSNDKIGICPACHEILTRQWIFYEKNDVPLNIRKYIINKVFARSIVHEFPCYLCHELLKPDQQQIIYCKFIKNAPYFPFLKNLIPPSKCFPITEKGFTFCCMECKHFLHRQWEEFEKSSVKQEERVYLTKKDQEIVKSSFVQILKQTCFICLKTVDYEQMKKVHFGFGSNINTDFLVSYFKANKLPYNNKLSNKLTCKTCFAKLKSEWILYHSSLFDPNKEEGVCEICMKCCKKSAINELSVVAANEFLINEPYFPALQHLCKPDKVTVGACQACSENLLKQWECKSTLLHTRVEDFICSLCENVVNNQYVSLQSIFKLNHGILLNSNPLCVRIGDQVIVCKECKEKNFEYTPVVKSEILESREPFETPVSLESTSDKKQISEMKATATVPPFLSLGTNGQASSSFSNDANCSKITNRFTQQHSSALPNTFMTQGKNLSPERIGPYSVNQHALQNQDILKYGERYGDTYERRDSFEKRLSSPTLILTPHKDRPQSSIGLVLPQPSRIKFEENQLMPGSLMSSSRYNHETAVAMRSPSPRFSPFLPPRLPHAPPSSCPVHGQEPGHLHDERLPRHNLHTHEDIRGRLPGLPMDPISHIPREFSSLYAQNSRLREEVQSIYSRHPSQQMELKEHRALEEDLRRRGLDYRWNTLPPHLLDEHYRRHLLNSGIEHSSYKESLQPPLYPPHFYYGRDYPLHIDPYMHYPPYGDTHYQHAPASPQLADLYRRSLSQRQDAKFDERIHRTLSTELLKRKNEQAEEKSEVKKQQSMSAPNEQKMPHFKGITNMCRSPSKLHDSGRQPNSVRSLITSELPDSKTELAAASILANMNRINQSPPDEIESLNICQTDVFTNQQKCGEDGSPEQASEKLAFFIALGLVTHSRKRALENEININRWNRKSSKFHGRPKKRTKREVPEDGSSNGDTRANSELDFYTGPMTRHKQQMLQEQESLLEEIKKRNLVDSIEGPVDETKSIKKETDINVQPFPTATKKFYKLYQPKIVSPPEKENNAPYKGALDHISDLERIKSIENGYRHTEHTRIFTREKSHEIDHESYRRDLLNRNESEFLKLEDYETRKESIYSGLQISRTPRESNLYAQTNHDSPLERAKSYRNTDNELARYMDEASPERFFRWPGVEAIGLSYKAYHAELVTRRNHLLKAYEVLNQEDRNAQMEREQLEKDMMIYNDRRMRLAERRQSMHQSLESMTNSLRSMSNF